MTFISLTFVALLAFGSLGLSQAEETCGAYNSDAWKKSAESSEGSCSRPAPQNVAQDIEEEGEDRTEAAEFSIFGIIQSVIDFILMIFKWYTNTNNK